MSVFTKIYSAPEFNKSEILRYAGTKEASSATLSLLDECLCECVGVFSYKVCFSEETLKITGNTLNLGTVKTESASLKKTLDGCERAVLFAAP